MWYFLSSSSDHAAAYQILAKLDKPRLNYRYFPAFNDCCPPSWIWTEVDFYQLEASGMMILRNAAVYQYHGISLTAYYRRTFIDTVHP